MWYAYFPPLSGFTFHTLSSLGVLGTADSKWFRAERNLREIQLALCASPLELQLLSWRRDAERRKGWEERSWEVLRKRGRGRKKRTRERKSRQPWFSVTPPQASCAIFNTQAYVLPYLSCPGFYHKTSQCVLLFWCTWLTVCHHGDMLALRNGKDRAWHFHVELHIPDLIMILLSCFGLDTKCVCVCVRAAACLRVGVHHGDDINYANSHQLR